MFTKLYYLGWLNTLGETEGATAHETVRGFGELAANLRCVR